MTSLSDILTSAASAAEDNGLGVFLSQIVSNNITDSSSDWNPLVDIADEGGYISIYMHVPGVDLGSLDVDFFNNKIKIKGSRAKPYVNHIKKEISYGSFSRELTLPISVTNRDAVSVSAENGVISIRINKSVEEQNRFSLNVRQATESS